MNRKHLPIWTAGHIAIMFVVAAVLGSRMSAAASYVLTIVIYWCICWALIFLFSKPHSADALRKETKASLHLLAFLPVIGVAVVALSKSLPFPAYGPLLVITLMALINGVTEETYWRKLYVQNFPEDKTFGLFIPCLLFAIWHIALLGIPAIQYEGGAAFFIFGAALLGVIWGVAYWLNRRFWAIAAAHVLVNIFAFTMLATDNGWIG